MFNFSSANILSATSLHPARMLAFALQTADADNSRLLIIFMGIAAISLLVLALVVVGVLIALAVVAMKASSTVSKTVQEVKAKVFPIIDKTNGLVGDLTPTIKAIAEKTNTLVGELSPTIKGITEKTNSLIGDLSPKISGISEDLHGITSRARDMVEFAEEKLHDFAPVVAGAKETLMEANATARAATDSTHRQVERVNEMVTGVLDWTNQLPIWLRTGLSLPGKKLGETAKQIRVKGWSVQTVAEELATLFNSKRAKSDDGSFVR